MDVRVLHDDSGVYGKRKVTVNGEEMVRDPRSTSRFMTSWNGVILKLDGYCNTGQVLSEVMLWPEIEEEDRKFFVPLLGCGLTKTGELWLVQEEVEFVKPTMTDDEAEEFSESLSDIMEKYEIWDVYPESFNGCGNWMMVNGCPKIYDWGLNKFWNDTIPIHNRGEQIPSFKWGS